MNSEGYSYVDEVPSLQPTQHRSQQPKSTASSAHRDAQQQNRARRAQRRVTHNEKRYHSGIYLEDRFELSEILLLLHHILLNI